MKTLAVCLLTYNRLEYAKRTLTAALKHIVFGGNIHVHIGDDGSGDEYTSELLACVPSGIPVTLSDSQRGGYGANYNLATQQAHLFSTHVLYLEDDWELVRSLDVDRITCNMDSLGDCCVRLGYIGYTQPLKATFTKVVVGSHWLLLDSESPEPHVFAGHPRIETIGWSRNVGAWPEGISPGETEFKVAHIKEARENVYWPMDMVAPCGDMFAHIGTVRSY